MEGPRAADPAPGPLPWPPASSPCAGSVLSPSAIPAVSQHAECSLWLLAQVTALASLTTRARALVWPRAPFTPTTPRPRRGRYPR